jgi:hypothetical protein
MSVAPGSGLTGGGNAGNISLAVDSTVARTNAGNTFTGNQTVNGNLITSGNLSSGGSLTIGGGTPISRFVSSAGGSISHAGLKPGACITLGVPFVGVSNGDTVTVTPASSLMQAPGTEMVTAWVGGPDVIVVRACNLDPNVTQKTTVSGVIRIDVWKH